MFGSIPLSGVAAALGGYLALAAQIGLAYEDIWLRARGEPLTVATWHLAPPEATRAVIIAHGIHRYHRQDFPSSSIALVEQLVHSGFTVLILDLRGHSASEPARMIYGIRERGDLVGAVDWLLAHDYAPGTLGTLDLSSSRVAKRHTLALAHQKPAALHMFSRASAAATTWGEKATVLAKHFDERGTLSGSYSTIEPAQLRPDYAHQRTPAERWSTAADIASPALEHPSVASISRIMALVVLGRLRARRGDPSAADALDEALELAAQTGRHVQRLGPVHAARAEAAWLAGNHAQLRSEARAIYDLAIDKRHPWFTGELGFWRWRAGARAALPPWMARPFRLQIAGEWQKAADAWERLYCPYERAMALMDGDSAAQHLALDIFEQLSAQPIAEIVRRKLRAAPHGKDER